MAAIPGGAGKSRECDKEDNMKAEATASPVIPFFLYPPDAAPALGQSRWKSAFSLYWEKQGRVFFPPKGTSAWNAGLPWVVEEMFTQLSKKEVEMVSALEHPEYPWMQALSVRSIKEEDALFLPAACNVWRREEWGECPGCLTPTIPAEERLQVLHLLAVTGFSRGYVGVLVGGEEFLLRVVERDENEIQDLVSREKLFVEQLCNKVPPVADGSLSTTRMLKQLYSWNVGDMELPEHADECLEDLLQKKEQRDALDVAIRERENEIKALMKHHETASNKRFSVSWKNVETTRLDIGRIKEQYPELYRTFCTTSQSRRFLVKKVA